MIDGAAGVDRPRGRARSWGAHALVVLGAPCLVLGVLAGYVYRTVLDADRFAAAVDEVRRQPAVSAALGRQLTDAVLQQRPDAVAVRPLIDAVATQVVGSDLLSGPTRVAAASFGRALTEPSAPVFLLRVADAGSVVTAALQRLAPGTITNGTQVSLQLAAVGSQSFAGRTLALARFVRVATWVLPLAGVVLLAAGLLLAPRRRRAVLLGGGSLLALAGVLAVALLAGAAWASAQGDATVRGALIAHGWPVVAGGLWWSVLAVAVAGLLLVASAAASVPDVDPTALARRVGALVSRRPESGTGRIVRAVVLLTVGVAAVARPRALVAVAGVVAGCWIVLQGVHELAAATDDGPDATAADATAAATTDTAADGVSRRAGRHARPLGLSFVAAAITVVVAVVAWGALPSSSASALATGAATGAVTGRGEVCNGYAALCDRRYPDVASVATHNAMSDATDPSWFIPEQGRSIVGQLDHGVRALLVDVWPGFPTAQGRVATARSAYADGKAQLEKEVGPQVVAAGLRVLDAVTDPTPAGPEALYLCHGLCELGGTPLAPTLADVRAWLDTHPDEVLSVIVEDSVPAERIGAAFTAAGLDAYAATPPPPGGAWPTLRDMITSGRRLVVMVERGDGGAAYPWLANAYERLVQETPYTARSLDDLSRCPPNRGRPDAPLLLLNHWLSGFGQLVTNARAANAAGVLGARAQLCRAERRIPTFVAVNYADLGDVDAVVRALNGVG